MSGIIALDVIVGLVFIYSLYSLLASLIQEIIATNLSFRAKVLEKAIVRMLQDDPEDGQRPIINLIKPVIGRIKGFIQLLVPWPHTSSGTLAQLFYQHPLVKYLGEDKWHRKPAYLHASNFSKVMIDLLRGQNFQAGDDPRPHIDTALQAQSGETAVFLKSLWADAQGDVERFRELLEKWFDDTMVRATEWYKKYNQVFLLLVGFGIAVFFNVDTVQIVRKLSTNEDLRKELVQQADAYMKNHPTALEDAREQKARIDEKLGSNPDQAAIDQAKNDKEKIDAAYEAYVKEMKALQSQAKALVEGDLKNVNNLLALGWGMQCDKKCGCKECRFLPNGLSWYSPIGWLLTALALSLGAPFWFDLLNKLMKLRGAVQVPPAAGTNPGGGSSTSAGVPTNKRVG